MTRVPALVVAGPGTNRDGDVSAALELAGAAPRTVLATELVADPRQLDDARLLVIAGGFSYADSLGAGRMLALDLTVGLGDELRAFVAAGRPVIGICNGFQVLTSAGLLPGALGHNAHGRFDCRWVELEAEPTSQLAMLSADELTILKLVRRLGIDVAMDRLLGVDRGGIGPGGRPLPDPGTAPANGDRPPVD